MELSLNPDFTLARPISYCGEKEFQFKVSALLAVNGIEHKTEVRRQLYEDACIIADFIVGDIAIEAKVDVKQDALIKAFGQCQAYIASGLAKRAALLVPHHLEINPGFVHLFKSAGIAVLSDLTLLGFLEKLDGGAVMEPGLTGLFHEIERLSAAIQMFDESEMAANKERIKREFLPVWEWLKPIYEELEKA